MSAADFIPRQLPLNVRLRDEATLDNFLADAPVMPLLMALEQQSGEQGEALIYLYGPPDAGKSHLLQACCHTAPDTAWYLPLSELAGYPPASVLQGVEDLQLVCLDDIDAVLGDEAWELALFNFFNRARARHCRLVISGSAAPRALAVDLPDLRSRLGWGIVYQLPAITDDQRQAVLRFRAARRGMNLPAEVARYIVSRAPRALGELLELLDQLDQLSLAEQRALTVPFVKRALVW